jgi:hypothetical protein
MSYVTLLDDKMQAGYDHQENGDVAACATAWLDAWADVLRLCDATGIGSVDEFDDRFSLTQSLFNWISDLEIELDNAGMKDLSFWTARIEVCREALRRFTDIYELTAGNLRRAWAESLFALGQEIQEMLRLTQAAHPGSSCAPPGLTGLGRARMYGEWVPHRSSSTWWSWAPVFPAST